MTSKSRKRRWLLVVGVLIPLLAAVYTFKSFTMPIFAQESIAELFELDVNGDAQYLLVRGADRKQPVMLFVHGGPDAGDVPRPGPAHGPRKRVRRRSLGPAGNREVIQGHHRSAQLSISLHLSDMDVVIDYL